MSIVIVLISILVVSTIISKFHPRPNTTQSFYEKENTEDLAPESAVVYEFVIDADVKKNNKSKNKYYYSNNKKSKKHKSKINN